MTSEPLLEFLRTDSVTIRRIIRGLRRRAWLAGYSQAVTERTEEFMAPDNVGGVLAKAIALVKAEPEPNPLDHVKASAASVRAENNQAVKRRERLEREL